MHRKGNGQCDLERYYGTRKRRVRDRDDLKCPKAHFALVRNVPYNLAVLTDKKS